LSKLLEIVDLPVEDDGDGLGLVVDRLLACGDINYREALNAKTDTVSHEEAALVWPTVGHGSAHPLKNLGVDRPFEVDLSRYSTHAVSSSRGRTLVDLAGCNPRTRIHAAATASGEWYRRM